MLIYFLAKARRAELTSRSYEAAYPMFTTSATAAAEQTLEESETVEKSEERVDAAEPEQTEPEQTEPEGQAREFVDISDKLEKLFDIHQNKDDDKKQ